MRHLHESGMDFTVCGLQLGHELGGSLASDMVRSVHVTKARKGDCAPCRNAYRAHVRQDPRVHPEPWVQPGAALVRDFEVAGVMEALVRSERARG
jgi:hypothetical protein